MRNPLEDARYDAASHIEMFSKLLSDAVEPGLAREQIENYAGLMANSIAWARVLEVLTVTSGSKPKQDDP